ncbi:MAG TPA: methyltransferase domain-containing protein [Anaerolineaceae bacterium]|nr:methyltransferase domain-containing protein [Anaerolineaceae bacterium]
MDEKETVVEAFTELAPRYETVVDSELHKFWGWSYEGFIQFLLENTPIESGELLLDIATGTGVIPRAVMKANPNCKIVGIDITRAMLDQGKSKLGQDVFGKKVFFTTGNAMQMPFNSQSFDLILCGLATHHMQVDQLAAEIYRILKPTGRFSLADVGGSKLWRNPIINFFIKILAYFYFLITENKDRAWAEASAVSNVFTAEDWNQILTHAGFNQVKITHLKSKKFWVPDPLLIQAFKS